MWVLWNWLPGWSLCCWRILLVQLAGCYCCLCMMPEFRFEPRVCCVWWILGASLLMLAPKCNSLLGKPVRVILSQRHMDGRVSRK